MEEHMQEMMKILQGLQQGMQILNERQAEQNERVDKLEEQARSRPKDEETK